MKKVLMANIGRLYQRRDCGRQSTRWDWVVCSWGNRHIKSHGSRKRQDYRKAQWQVIWRHGPTNRHSDFRNSKLQILRIIRKKIIKTLTPKFTFEHKRQKQWKNALRHCNRNGMDRLSKVYWVSHGLGARTAEEITTEESSHQAIAMIDKLSKSKPASQHLW